MFASLADVQELHQYISCLKAEQPKVMKLLRWAFAFYFRGWGESSEGGCICSPLGNCSFTIITSRSSEGMSPADGAFSEEVPVHHSSGYYVRLSRGSILHEPLTTKNKRRYDKSLRPTFSSIIVAHYTREYQCGNRKRYAIAFTTKLSYEIC